MQKNNQWIIGIIFILLGIGYGGEAFDLWHFTIFFNGWWTLFLIIPSIISMVKSGLSFMNIFFLICGLYFLLRANVSMIGLNDPIFLVSILSLVCGIYIIYKNMK